MKIAIAAGGTGGHIYPGLAVAQVIKQRDPGAQIIFIGGTEGLEQDLIPREGYRLKLIKARALLRKLSYKAFSAPFVCLIGFFQAISFFLAFSPAVVLATGGYVSLPAVMAAWLLRIPVIIQEQNLLPGAVTRLASRFAQKCFLSFPQTQKHLRGEVIGNPVRKEIIKADRVQARQSLGLKKERVVLVVGGSQGAKKLNETILSALPDLPFGVKVIHLVGRRDAAWINNHLAEKNFPNYQTLSYVYDMAAILAAADLVISRAGATAIAEFLVRGLPMILIPFPYAADDHQALNARAVAEAGAAISVPEKDFTPAKFIALLQDISLDYDKMSQAAKALARPEAAERIVNYIYA